MGPVLHSVTFARTSSRPALVRQAVEEEVASVPPMTFLVPEALRLRKLTSTDISP